MKKRFAGVCLMICCLLLSSCASLLDREYSTVEKHTSKYRESDAGDTLRAETYQDVVNDLLLLVSERREDATLRLYGESRDIAADIMERAAAEVKRETAMGSYAVEYITARIWIQYGDYAADIHIAYRRSADQMSAVVNATSTAALSALLDDAMRNGRKELAVRIGYWEDADFERVEEAVAATREKWGEESDLQWVASYYPAQGEVGLIEFRLENVTEPERTPDENESEGSVETPVDTSGEVSADVPGDAPSETMGEPHASENTDKDPTAGQGTDALAGGEPVPGTAENAGEQLLTGEINAPGAGEEVRPDAGTVAEETAAISQK